MHTTMVLCLCIGNARVTSAVCACVQYAREKELQRERSGMHSDMANREPKRNEEAENEKRAGKQISNSAHMLSPL